MLEEGNTPFDRIRKMIRTDMLLENLKKVKMGNYTILQKCLRKLINIKELTIENLEKIPKIGSKTSRMILLHSQKNVRYAVLDTHILRYMRENLGTKEISTPSKKKYLELEKIFLNHCDILGRDASELDLEIWKRYTKSKEKYD